MPRVEITGVGPLSFPKPRSPRLCAGRSGRRTRQGENTIVDTSVRNVWQIAPSQVEISGKSWGANFENILSNVKAGVGCEDAIVSAKFYKLLVYDQGGFFLAHRDTEKTAGMFGTLVVTLPSAYRGGALRKLIASARASRKRMSRIGSRGCSCAVASADDILCPYFTQSCV
jgi:hypothetical protein